MTHALADRRRRTGPVGADALKDLANARGTVVPVAPFRLPWVPRDGVSRRHDGLLERVVTERDELVLLRAAQARSGGAVVLGAWAQSPETAELALARWRRTLGVDVDHRPFLRLADGDPVLGPLVRARPWLRPSMNYRPHETLVNAITEQLIEFSEALRIQRGLVQLAGARCLRTGLRDAPSPQALLDLAPAQIEALGLSARRTLLLRQVCRLLVRGLDLDATGPERDAILTRLRAIPGLGAWTLSLLALRGQGDPDASPSGDLGLLKAVGRLLYLERVALEPAGPATFDHARGARPTPQGPDHLGRMPLATEVQVHELVSRFAPWRGYAAWHLFMA